MEYMYRGKSIENGEWIFGYLHMEIDSNNRKVSYIYNLERMNPVDLKTIGLYTGLNDKNNNNLWEWDIVQYTKDNLTKIYLVVWVEDKARFMLKRRKNVYYSFSQSMLTKIEKLGNAFDNPEYFKNI